MSFKLFVFALAASAVTTGCGTVPASRTTGLPQAQVEVEAQKMGLEELIQTLENAATAPNRDKMWTLEGVSKILGTQFRFKYSNGYTTIYDAEKEQIVLGEGLVIEKAEVTIELDAKSVTNITLPLSEESSLRFNKARTRHLVYDNMELVDGGIDGVFFITTGLRPWGGRLVFTKKDTKDEKDFHLTEIMLFDTDRFKTPKLDENSSLPPPSLLNRVAQGLGLR